MRGVLDGSVPACQAIRKAVERHLRDLAQGPARGLFFDEAAAERVIRFFRIPQALEGRVGRPSI